MKRSSTFSFLISYAAFLLALTSCSLQKQVSRSADKLVINDSSFRTAHLGISIYDPSENKYLYNYQGDKYFVPASNTKIPTCYAGMKYLGDSLVGLRYQFVDNNALIFQPAGDPTFLHPDYKTNRVFDFLRMANPQLILADPRWRSDGLGSGWSWNDYDQSYMAERSSFPMYGNLARFTYNGKEFVSIPEHFNLGESSRGSNRYRVNRALGTNDFFLTQTNQANTSFVIPFVTDTTTWLAVLGDTLKKIIHSDYTHHLGRDAKLIYSHATDSMLKPMMHRSDNFFAEQTLMMVSNEFLDEMNDSRLIDTLLKTDFKDLPQRPRWADGSGLSRYNLFTPQDFVFILNKMMNEFGMDRIKEVFPTGGEGTLSSFYKDEAGYLYAKTGTLSGVVALSGFLYTKKNKLLIFSILVNNHRASATDIRRALEKFLKGLRDKG